MLDAVAARGLLEQAAAHEPDTPLIQSALASAWTALGYDARAAAAAQKAVDASAALNREDRLIVEGRLEKYDGVTSVKGDRFWGLHEAVEYEIRSHDFH